MMTDLLTQYLMDVFRIGLIIGLVVTTLRTQGVTGRVIPLLAGVVFVAIIIPAAMQTGSGVPLWQAVGVGIVANLLLLAVVLGAWMVIRRFLPR